jgi:ABC-type branched-subunit amino acid transport system substrate-binding protein
MEGIGEDDLTPLAQFMVQTYGKRWGIVYPDYALGQSQVDSFAAALGTFGGDITFKLAIPVGEPNVTPYVTRIPTDGSIDGLINAENGSDLARVVSVMSQFGLQTKLPMVGTGFAKDFFAGVFPDGLTGSISMQIHLDPPAPDNPFDQAYVNALRAHAQQDLTMANVAGGADNLTPGTTGYPVYANISFLKLGMQASGYETRKDADKLIVALETISRRGQAPISLVADSL